MMKHKIWRCVFLLSAAVLVQANGVIIKNEHENKTVQVSTGKFRIPDPFDLKSLEGEKSKGEFYFFKSSQTSYEEKKQSRKVVVKEYFSLGAGLSFSLHQDLDHPDREWAIIGDSKRSRFYVVRNPHAEQLDELDCELDHAHNQRQVFPWQFVYELKDDKPDESENKNGDDVERSSERKKGKKKGNKKRSNKRKKAFVYGLGAIWLNAITLDARTDLVDEQSSYPNSNSWFITGRNGLKVELLFDKLSEKQVSRFENKPEQYQQKLDQTRLKSVRVDRSGVIENPLAASNSAVAPDIELEFINLDSYRSGVSREEEPELEQFFVQLEQCRRATKAHRLFPSLLRSLSTSAGQHYQMRYILQRFPLYKETNGARAEGKYDERKHRYTYPMEYVSEVFSLAHESQTNIYWPLPLEGAGAGPGSGRTDVFLARFTERANNQRSSRHSTAHYHIIEHENDYSDNPEPQCKKGEHEPLPAEHLFVRTLNFKRSLGQDEKVTVDYHGHLTGLGALLMNAADFHYKSFSLTAKTIRVAQNPNDLSEFREAKVDEWRLRDTKLGWSIHFFVELRDSEREELSLDLTDRARGDLARLVRVDIRDARKVDMSTDELDAEDEAIAIQENTNLLLQFTLSQVDFDTDEDDVEFLLTPPDVCQADGNEANDSDSEPNYDSASELDEGSFFDDPDNDQFNENFSASDQSDEEPDEAELDLEQKQGEEFELDAGMMHEDLELPSFFDFIDGYYAYEMDTKIVLEQSEDEDEDEESSATPKSRKHIWLRENVNLKEENILLNIYNSDEAHKLNQATESFYIFYESELVFQVAEGRCKHWSDIETSKWLRLFTAPFNYYTVPNIRGERVEKELVKSKALIEKSRISMYGVGALWRRATESQFSVFLGKKRKLVELEGRKYRELVWNYEEHEMDIHFHFLQDLSLIEEDRANNHHRPARDYLTLHSVEFKNEFAHDQHQVNTFGRIRAQVAPLISKASHYQLTAKMIIPAICEDQYVEAQRMREQNIHDIRPPSFFDLPIGKAASYEMSYIISHELGSAEEMKLGQTLVREVFDQRKNVGIMDITAGNSHLILFIDANNKRIYAYLDSKQFGKSCSLVPSIAPIFGKAINLQLGGNPDFDPKKMYGLANLWIELAKLDGNLRVHYFKNKFGRKKEVLTYKFHIDQSSANNQEQQTVMMRFRKKRNDLEHVDISSRVLDGTKTRSQEQLLLATISVDPAIGTSKSSSSRNKHNSNWHSSDIQVIEMWPDAKVDWQLPKECEELDSNENAPNGDWDEANQTKLEPQSMIPDKSHPFPELKSLLERVNMFHMKSEVSIKGALEKVYLLEEWTHNNHIRMRSRGLGKSARRDFDFIIYEDSKERFDLSRPFGCKKDQIPESPLELNLAKELESNLIEVWYDDQALINHLSLTYYSPLTLWRMANKSSVRRKLVTELEIAPLPSLADGDVGKFLDLELERETWLVEAPPDSPLKWSYKMNFVRKSRILPNGQPDIWHILQSVSINDFEPTNFNANEQPQKTFSVLIEVANYKYNAQADDILDKFLLPEGWGCRRATEFVDKLKSYDKLRLFESENWLLIYEASLQLIGQQTTQDPELGALDMEAERQMMPTSSGLFLRSGTKLVAIQPEMELATHHSQIRYQDGHTLARRTVIDRCKSIEFEVDKANGLCSAELVPQAGWRLDFSRSANKTLQGHTVNLLTGDLSDSLFEHLFLETSSSSSNISNYKFSILNRFSFGGKGLETSYEGEVDSVKLTRDLVGPARIVRKFSQTQSKPKSELTGNGQGRGLIVKWHDELTTRLFLFDQTKTKLRAVLDIHLKRGPEPNLAHLLSSVQVRQCFNGGTPHWDEEVGTFTLDYEIKSDIIRKMVSLNQEMMRDNFYGRLMRTTGLLPLQLDGAAQIEAKGSLVHVHFSVMDAPTSHVYFRQTEDCAMEETMEMECEWRHLSTLLDCSHWCDQTNCVAMSFGELRICRIVSARAVFGKEVKSISSNDTLTQTLNVDQLKRLSSCKKTRFSNYFFQDRPQPRPTLARFGRFMDRAVNQERATGLLKDLSIELRWGSFEAVAFYENSGRFRARSDPTDDPIEADEVVAITEKQKSISWNQRKYTFGLLERDKKLAFDQTEASGESCQLDIKPVHSIDIGDCETSCEIHNCIVLSYCEKDSECILASAEKSSADLRPIQKGLLNATGCSVYVRDRLSSFRMYQNTNAPKQAHKRVEEVSALVCAAMCQAEEEQCLSFDYCTYTLQATPENKNAIRSICMMQKSHVSLDTFDQSVLLSKLEESFDSSGTTNLVAENRLECDHYSKNLLTDFKQLADRKMKQRVGGILRGLNEEHCAWLCIQDEQCRAFEFCRDDRRHPPQSCRLLREQHLTDVSATPESQSSQLSQMLSSSNTCSIFLARDLVRAERVERISGQPSEPFGAVDGPNESTSSSPFKLLWGLSYLIATVLLGALVQFVHIKVTNRALVFKQQVSTRSNT